MPERLKDNGVFAFPSECDKNLECVVSQPSIEVPLFAKSDEVADRV
ncbi:hypothetical protein OHB12_31945 [Nocardia sp. NBC_01730]|nr:hypothetical protein OHB12_31945 [Nocardia sp. NBC_01730]